MFSCPEELNIQAEIIKIYDEVDGICGYRRITLNLNRKLDQRINHKHVYRLMKLASLQSVICRKKKRYIKSAPQQVSENPLNREFTADRPAN